LRPTATAAFVGGALALTSALGGAYLPPSWGLSGLSFLAALALVLLLAHSISLSRLELAFLGALAAFTAWVTLSAIWSQSVTRTVLELERDLLYVVAATALLALAPRCSSRWILGAVPAATAVVCAWALTSRTFADGRLVGPVGYWNALGLFCAIGTLVALGFTIEGARRSMAAAAVVLFVATLYLTYSRGGLLVLAAGLAVQLGLSPRRLRLAGTVVLLLPPCAAAVVLASHWDGVRFRLGLAVLALVAAAVPAVADAAAARLQIGPRVRRAATIAAVLPVVAVVVFGLVRTGGLGATASRAYRSFTGPAPTAGARGRTLLSASSAGRAEYWQVAWRDFRRHPILGSGAGTFTLAWDRDRHTVYDVLDAHSLYIEVLGELGVIGLLLVLGIFVTPLLALRRVPRTPLTAAAAGAYVAYVLHAGLDWDWEVPAVTLAGLACGCALLVAARDRPVELGLPVRAAGLAAAAILAAFVAVTYVGNIHLAHGAHAYDTGRYADAASEADRAARVLRWSSDPWELRGDAELSLGLRDDAHRSYLRALERDPHDWRLWYDAGISTRGRERADELARAARLNPLARQILGLHLR
jgi:hypothetical protein